MILLYLQLYYLPIAYVMVLVVLSIVVLYLVLMLMIVVVQCDLGSDSAKLPRVPLLELHEYYLLVDPCNKRAAKQTKKKNQ